MNWLKDSIMMTKGVGKDSEGKTHHLTEKTQGTYQYTMGPYSEPVMHIKPGDTVVVETRDAFEGKIQKETDKPSEKLEMPFLNPQNGPIMIEGAEKGDALAVYIDKMVPRGNNPLGTCCMIEEFGALTGTTYTATLNNPLPEKVRKIDLDEKNVYWSDRITLPYKPHIGTLSCSPEIDSINSLTPDNHGGNMDAADVCPGNTIILPVNVDGGLLYIGDGHAAQGDAEVCGVATEIPTLGTLRVELIKGLYLRNPRVESNEFIMTIGSARPMEDAARIAFYELIMWLQDDYGIEKLIAYQLCSQVARVRLANMVDTLYSVVAKFPKKYLPKLN